MNFWDSSAIIPLCDEEPSSNAVLELKRLAPRIAVWWAATVEAASAIERKFRMGEGTVEDKSAAHLKLRQLAESWLEVAPSESIRLCAQRLLSVHPLRAADALQLAAALAWRERDRRGTTFVCLDNRLREAAAKEGFKIAP